MQPGLNNSNQTPVIGLMGPFGFGNLGDAAIQQAIIQHLYERYPQAKVIGFWLNPQDTEMRHNIWDYSVGRIASYGWAGRGSGGSKFERFSLGVNRFRRGLNKYLRPLFQLFFSIELEIISIIEASRRLKG